MRRRLILLALTALFLSASLVTLAISRSIERPEMVSASAPAIGLVRGYYAALNAFLAGGDPNDVSEFFADSASISSPNGELVFGPHAYATELAALSETYPRLAVTIDSMYADGDRLVARINLDHVATALPSFVEFGHLALQSSRFETFEIERGMIAGHHSTLLDLPRYAPLTDGPIELTVMRESRLAIASVSLPARQTQFVRLPGPGILRIMSGSVEVAGGVTNLVTGAPGGEPRAMANGEVELLTGGAAIISTVSGPVIRNASSKRAELLIVAMAMKLDTSTVGEQTNSAGTRLTRGEGEVPVDVQLIQAVQAETGSAVSIGKMVVRSLHSSDVVVPIGKPSLETGIIALPAGTWVELDRDMSWTTSASDSATPAVIAQENGIDRIHPTNLAVQLIVARIEG